MVPYPKMKKEEKCHPVRDTYRLISPISGTYQQNKQASKYNTRTIVLKLRTISQQPEGSWEGIMGREGGRVSGTTIKDTWVEAGEGGGGGWGGGSGAGKMETTVLEQQ